MHLLGVKQEGGYLHAERYANNFKKVANEVTQSYCAIEGEECFKLPFLYLDLNEVEGFFAFPSPEIFNKIVKNGKVKFFIHPDMIEEFEIDEISGLIEVSPTSSTRTVLPLNEDFMIKMHLNRRLYRFIRRLKGSSVEHSVLISSEIEGGLENSPETFAYLPESMGFIYKDKGFIIREIHPRPKISEKRVFLPLFSFYSDDLKDLSSQTLFEQLVSLRKKEPLQFFLDYFIEPIFKNMSYFINEYGLLLECHGQNVLVELDNHFNIKRMIHRDFQSMYIDEKIRKSKGLSEKFCKHIMGKECQREVSYSLVYDQYLGKYVLDNFTSLLNKRYNLDIELIKRKIKELFVKYFEVSSFPKNGYYVMKKAEFKGNSTEFEFIQGKPSYRP